jgi:uncharacterized protein YjbI with pentapeptide repeats
MMALLSRRIQAARSMVSSALDWTRVKAVVLLRLVAAHQKKLLQLSLLVALLAIPTVWAIYLSAHAYVWADWTGFGPYTGTLPAEDRGKTLWDWLQVLIVPLALAVVAYVFSTTQKKNEAVIARRNRNKDIEIAADRFREEALQLYLDRMAELLLKENLLETKNDANSNVRKIAQVQTVTTLRKVDTARQNIITQYLRDAGLASFLLVKAFMKNIDLHGADLSVLDLSGADLRAAGLQESQLSGTLLSGANLNEVDLSRGTLNAANLYGAKLRKANLYQADLQDANLIEADLIEADLRQSSQFGARLMKANLSRANLSDSSLFAANLSATNLYAANLSNVDLREATLSMTDFRQANLTGANLSGVDLHKANISKEQLAQAGSLKGATLPDGPHHK